VQKVKEQLAARLDAPKEASVTVDNIKWVKQKVEGVCIKLYFVQVMKVQGRLFIANNIHDCLAKQWPCWLVEQLVGKVSLTIWPNMTMLISMARLQR
jgi:hypothetical protein